MRKVGEEVQIALLERRKTIEVYDMFRKQNLCRIDRRPAKQGSRPQLRDQGWVEKSATGTMKLKPVMETIKIGTWNVQTLWRTGKLELLRHEMEPYNCDILGLAEMRWTGSGEINGAEVIWSGEEKTHSRGVGFMLSPRARRAL